MKDNNVINKEIRDLQNNANLFFQMKTKKHPSLPDPYQMVFSDRQRKPLEVLECQEEDDKDIISVSSSVSSDQGALTAVLQCQDEDDDNAIITSPLLKAVNQYKNGLSNDKESVVLRGKQLNAINLAKQLSAKTKSRAGMELQFQKSVGTKLKGLSLGDIVSIRVDENQQYKHRNTPVLGIIYKLTKNGLPYILTEHGAIGTKDGQPRTLPPNRFLKVPNQFLPLNSKFLTTARENILSTGYVPGTSNTYVNSAVKPIVTLHRESHDEGHELIRRCGCKKSPLCSTRRCTCVQHGTPCTERCGCKGNCNRMKNDLKE